jgi:hypothetical protein
MNKAELLKHSQLPDYLKKFIEKETTVVEVVGAELIAKGDPFVAKLGFRLDGCGNLIIRGTV